VTIIPANVDLSALGIYNVKSPPYNAYGDGTHDDTIPIQLAVNDAFEAGGGIVYLPSGKYLINGSNDPSTGPPQFVRPTQPGGNNGTYGGTTIIPTDPGTGSPYVLVGNTSPNNGNGTMLPNGPVLLFDNVVLAGDGPEQSILLAGENIYGGWMLGPDGSRQSGQVVATANWWADYLDSGGFPTPYEDGFYAHKVIVRDLSIDCQGQFCTNHGQPQMVFNAGVLEVNPVLTFASNGVTPVGQLSGDALTIHATENFTITRVWVYDGNVNGILAAGINNSNMWPNGPLPESFQQIVGGHLYFAANPVYARNPRNAQQSNIPIMNGTISECQVDMNYPEWLAGSSSSPAGSTGQLPIRAVGCGAIILAYNRVGQRNTPSNFPAVTAPLSNLPNVAPNTNDAMDLPGCWHVLAIGNILTACGDGIGSHGNGDMIVIGNVMYNFGSVGFDGGQTNGKSASQTVIMGNTFFLGSDSGSRQPAIYLNDSLGGGAFNPQVPVSATATPGSVVISGNAIYGSAYSPMIHIQTYGVTVTGNVLDYGGVQPPEQPTFGGGDNGPGSGPPEVVVWPAPNGAGIQVLGNDVIIEGNMFRNAGPPGTPVTAAVGVSLSPTPITGDVFRVIVKGNIFDPTIGTPIQSGTGSLRGIRVLDNIGVNPAGVLPPGLIPFPLSGATFANPYPYDCFVTVNVPSGAAVSAVTLNGAVTGTSITAGTQKAFLVKAGGTIELTYTTTTLPISWTWVGL
jgi:hypothetical protein